MTKQIHRRRFVENAAGITAAAAGFIAGVAGENPSAAESARNELPSGEIKNLRISRLLLGGNLLTHFTHSRDLRYVYNLARHYNTDEKILETLALAESHGINTLIIHYVPHAIELLKEHRRRGGKMQWIMCTAHALANGGLTLFKRQIEALVEAGANALYISGLETDNCCAFRNDISGPKADEQVGPVQLDLLRQGLEFAKSFGLPVGMAAHRMGAVEMCEKAGFEHDFWMVTFHRHGYPSVDLHFDSRWCSKPVELARFMETVKKPWIAFKVMAAGAIPPETAFRYAFRNGADFVVAGMFDFEIATDVAIVKKVLATLEHRQRPWFA